MSKNKLATESYKGVRDFYPEDMAVQNYIFSSWRQTAKSFGFEQYDASILEPAILYRSKGAENAEMVDEQTYTFIDRGEREVTLRPEMTPTVARLVAQKRRELFLPIRWYSIPNLFRYERPQRGRLREHWQLNCDIFGVADVTADIEIIALAYQVLKDFGASDEMFSIRVNNREEMTGLYANLGLTDPEIINTITGLNDRKNKIKETDYLKELVALVKDETLAQKIKAMVENQAEDNAVVKGLKALGINNAKVDRSIARGFNYYTGMIFEIVDTDPQNNRSMIGGGRYDNLTALFSDEAITGVGFGMGDVTMRDFLITHNLLPKNLTNTAPKLLLIPISEAENLEAYKLAKIIREKGIVVAIDNTDRKLGKKVSEAGARGCAFALVVGPDEVSTGVYTLRDLKAENSTSGSLDTLLPLIQKD